MKKSWLERITDFVENKVAPPLLRISQMRYLSSAQRTFITLMPYMIVGATAVLVLNFGGLFGEAGLNMPSVAETVTAIVAPFRDSLLQMVFVTINIIALMAALLNGYFLGEYYHSKDNKVSALVAGCLGLVSFLCFIDWGSLSAQFDWPAYILGSPSIFGSLIISAAGVEIYRFLIAKNITIKMPESVPPMVINSFTSLIPVTVILVVFSLLSKGINGFNLLAAINQLFSYFVVGGSSVVAQFFAFFLDRLLWFVGLHGSTIVETVMGPVWTQMITENVSAFSTGLEIPHLFTAQWVNFYVRCSLFPIAILLIRSKSQRFKSLGKLSLPGTVFNIAEPIMFGLPIVLNPLMFVPWVLGFSVLFIFNAALGLIGLAPPAVAMVAWTMPVPLMAFIGSGFNIGAMVLSIINMVLIYFIFLPFFKVMERKELEEERKIENQQLQEAVVE